MASEWAGAVLWDGALADGAELGRMMGPPAGGTENCLLLWESPPSCAPSWMTRTFGSEVSYLRSQGDIEQEGGAFPCTFLAIIFNSQKIQDALGLNLFSNLFLSWAFLQGAVFNIFIVLFTDRAAQLQVH